MDSQKEIIQARLDSLRFLQNYVKKSTVEGKRWIEHLRSKWGPEWRDHRFDLKRDVSQKVIDELAFLDLHLPLLVEKRENIYIVQNGTNTAYSYWKRRIETIPVKISDSVFAGKRRLYRFEEIVVEE